MNLNVFAVQADLLGMSEVDRCAHLVFFLSKDKEIRQCSYVELRGAIDMLHYSRPNFSRMARSAIKSKKFIKSGPGSFRLHAAEITELAKKFPDLSAKSEVVAFLDGKIIPVNIYSECPLYIKKLADQINAAFEQNIFDGCAVLMRRLLEILLIRSYENLNIQGDIQDSAGNYKMLEGIAQNAKTNSKIGLSRTTKAHVDKFRTLGNFAAHRIEYSTRRGDIDSIQLEYRAAVEELMHKSGMIQSPASSS